MSAFIKHSRTNQPNKMHIRFPCQIHSFPLIHSEKKKNDILFCSSGSPRLSWRPGQNMKICQQQQVCPRFPQDPACPGFPLDSGRTPSQGLKPPATLPHRPIHQVKSRHDLALSVGGKRSLCSPIWPTATTATN